MITQLNATYVPLEDRILFRFNTRDDAEYRLWLTRAMVLGVLRACGNVAIHVAASENPGAYAKDIADFKQEAVAQSTQFTQLKPATTLPMGDVPVLVHRVDFKLSAQVYEMAFFLVNAQTLTVRLNEDLFTKFKLLLETVEKKASWGLSGSCATEEGGSSDDASSNDRSHPVRTVH